ncbi:MAG TPA: prepilin-type N-terminal cleavage/methylation domain-containing protein [Tepidisphaeraceae bacterium]|nr:prepilin-type N-terminal cleavage/methylation domain-containing protein [Tepidisphaeraceae bacterium]
MTRNIKRGFTLVEILIVVIILGILAAIVIPQFTNASEDARRSSMTSQLQTLRSQIELFKLQHKDNLPGVTAGAFSEAEFWRHLTTKTDMYGAANPAAADAVGPYLQNKSANNLVLDVDSTKVVPSATDPATGLPTVAAAAGQGYLYDWETTGKIWAVEKNKNGVYQVFAE